MQVRLLGAIRSTRGALVQAVVVAGPTSSGPPTGAYTGRLRVVQRHGMPYVTSSTWRAIPAAGVGAAIDALQTAAFQGALASGSTRSEVKRSFGRWFRRNFPSDTAIWS